MSLRDIPIFEGLSEADVAELTAVAIDKEYSRNAAVITQGELSGSLYLIKSGRVKVSINSENGKEVILSFLGAGEYFGEMSLFDDAPRSATVTTIEKTVLSVLSKHDFRRCITASPQIALHVIRDLIKRLRQADQKIESLASLDVYNRVLKTLLSLSSVNDRGHWVVRQKLSQQELANLVGASREMVNRILKTLSESGVIEIIDKTITILQPDILERGERM